MLLLSLLLAATPDVPLRYSELSTEQLVTVKQRLVEDNEESDAVRKSTGLMIAGGAAIISGALATGFGLLIALVPYVNTDGPLTTMALGIAGIIGGNVMLGIGISKAATRKSYLERIEALDAVIQQRAGAPKSSRRSAPIFRFTVAEF